MGTGFHGNASEQTSPPARSPSRRPLWAGLLASVVLLFCGRAVADTSPSREQAQAEIDALVAGGQSGAAVAPATALAKRYPDDVELWLQVRKFAEWNSQAEPALVAIENLVRLKPRDRDLRLALAQRLLWANRAAEAVPHAQFLLDNPEERDPVALEVAAWVFLGVQDRQTARAAVERWIAAAPDKASPRWVLADLTHWSADWRVARTQYHSEPVRAHAEFGPKAQQRLAMLQRDHPSQVLARFTGWSDNQRVGYLSWGVEARVQLARQLVLHAEADAGRWSWDENEVLGWNVDRQENILQVNKHRLRFGRATARLGYELADWATPDVFVGVESDSAGNIAEVVGVGTSLSLVGKVFGRVELRRDRYRASLVAAREDIREFGPMASIYAEPHPWVFLATQLSLKRLSDDNTRYYALGALGAHNPGSWQVEPRGFAVYEQFDQQRVGAQPYFTPPTPVTLGYDLTLRYRESRGLFRIDVSYGRVWQGGIWAHRPGVVVQGVIRTHWVYEVIGGWVGSPAYQQKRVDAKFGYRF